MLAHLDFLAWAQDGQKLALVDGTYRSTWYLKAIAVANLSGPLEVLSDASRADLFPAFSPDGQWIAFTSAPAIQTDGGNDAKQGSAARRIWVMAADGGAKRQITTDPAFRDGYFGSWLMILRSCFPPASSRANTERHLRPVDIHRLQFSHTVLEV